MKKKNMRVFFLALLITLVSTNTYTQGKCCITTLSPVETHCYSNIPEWHCLLNTRNIAFGGISVQSTIYRLGDLTSCGATCFDDLPVSPSSFKVGVGSDNSIKVLWETANETNNEYFKIEHSTNLVEFKEIGSVKGNRTTTQKHKYTFIHSNPVPGLNYYRIKQVDFDGLSTYSKIINVIHKISKISVRIFPNPVASNNNLLIDVINIERKDDIELVIFDLAGRELYNKKQRKSTFNLTMNWRAGTYFIRIACANQRILKKLVVK